ncbi:MAG: spermidine/putrescine transport system permease protein, partial [Actinomycetota bacterium]|nr:spermidine/putrescine transport system permease protein [Actinomycetota bacterium]
AGLMAATTESLPARAKRPVSQRAGRWLSNNLIRIYAVFGFTYLFIPVGYTFVYSFNNSGKSNLNWRGFTTDKWANPCGAPDVCNALSNSLKIGLIATAVATVLGTMIAFALARHRFRGRTVTNLTIFLPMATPEVVLGASLLAFFLNVGVPLGFQTIVIAHIMFCISFVVVTVKARLASLDPRLEQAAMDLYADEWQTFRRITFPLVLPGIVAGALLAFSLSFDDFIITNFNSGDVNTFPKFVWVSSLRGIPAQANVIGSAMFFIALFAVLLGQAVTRRRRA